MEKVNVSLILLLPESCIYEVLQWLCNNLCSVLGTFGGGGRAVNKKNKHYRAGGGLV